MFGKLYTNRQKKVELILLSKKIASVKLVPLVGTQINIDLNVPRDWQMG